MYMISRPIFFEDLSSRSFIGLVNWLEEAIGTQVTGSALEALYDEFIEAVDMTDKSPKDGYTADDYLRLVANGKIYRSPKFRRALVALRAPKPRVYIGAEFSKLIDITAPVFGERVGTLLKQADSDYYAQVNGYYNDVSYLLDVEGYRGAIREFIRDRRTRQSYLVYRLPTRKTILEGVDIDTVLERLSGYKVQRSYSDEKAAHAADKKRIKESEGGETWGAIHQAEAFGIKGSGRARLFKGEDMEKPMFVRLAYFLGVDHVLTEKMMNREGYTIQRSGKVADKLYYNCLRIGFPINYANELCTRKGLKPLL